MSRLIVTAPILALAATAVPAHAEDSPWTGLYVGGHGGFIDTSSEWKGTNTYQTVVDGGEGNLSTVAHNDAIVAKQSHSEAGAGGHLGYNFQSGSMVFGAEADFTLFGFTRNTTNTTTDATYTLHTRASDLETIRLRAGYAFDKVLIFATGGVAFSNLKHSLSATDASQTIVDGGEGGPTIGDATANLFDKSSASTGWTIGGGAEAHVAHGISLELTLLHVDFGSEHLASASAPSSIAASVKSKMFVGMLGLNLDF